MCAGNVYFFLITIEYIPYTYAKFHLTKQITAYGDHTDVAKALLAYGADINALDSKGYSPLMVAGKKKVA